MVIIKLNYWVILSATDLKNERGGGGSLFRLSPPRPLPASQKRSIWKTGERTKKLEFVSCAFCAPSRSSSARGGFWSWGWGVKWVGERAHRCQYPSGNNKNSFKWAMSPSSMYWLDLTRVETCVDHIYGINEQLKDLSFFWSILFVPSTPLPPCPGPPQRLQWQSPSYFFITDRGGKTLL